MLTVRDVAARCHVSPALVYKLVAQGRLACHRVGHTIRFSEEQLEQYLTEARSQAQPANREDPWDLDVLGL